MGGLEVVEKSKKSSDQAAREVALANPAQRILPELSFRGTKTDQRAVHNANMPCH